jgi:catechol 2,3-dioxygenase-like lactoylglutathione lyase family enzyme
MEIKTTNILVNDQEKALRFYTGKLGFVKKEDLPDGAYRWLTVTSKDEQNGITLVLEGTDLPYMQTFQKAQFKAEVPSLMLYTKDFYKEYKRLRKLGVVFRGTPESMGTNTGVRFEDTCGNILILMEDK